MSRFPTQRFKISRRNNSQFKTDESLMRPSEDTFNLSSLSHYNQTLNLRPQTNQSSANRVAISRKQERQPNVKLNNTQPTNSLRTSSEEVQNATNIIKKLHNQYRETSGVGLIQQMDFSVKAAQPYTYTQLTEQVPKMKLAVFQSKFHVRSGSKGPVTEAEMPKRAAPLQMKIDQLRQKKEEIVYTQSPREQQTIENASTDNLKQQEMLIQSLHRKIEIMAKELLRKDKMAISLQTQIDHNKQIKNRYDGQNPQSKIINECPKCHHQFSNDEEVRPVTSSTTQVNQKSFKKYFTEIEINQMDFQRKESEEQLSQQGYLQSQRCYLCKWHIEKGNYVLRMHGCGHTLHKKCLEVWFLSNAHCPICLKPQRIQELSKQANQEQ